MSNHISFVFSGYSETLDKDTIESITYNQEEGKLIIKSQNTIDECFVADWKGKKCPLDLFTLLSFDKVMIDDEGRVSLIQESDNQISLQ